MANQDSWARSLANTLVNDWKSDNCDFIRVRSTYDPATGAVTPTETRYEGVGAVQNMTLVEEGGAGEQKGIICYFSMSTIGDIYPTTEDYVEYDAKRWKIGGTLPENAANKLYGGDVKYAAKVLALYSEDV